MSLIRTVWKCTLSPRLFRIYETNWIGRLVDRSYKPRRLEKWSNHIVVSFAVMWSMRLYTIPLVITFLYQRSSPLTENIYALGQFAASASIVFIASLAARGSSRANNPVYLKFLKTLEEAQAHNSTETRQELHKYDFDFWAWPVDFRVSDVEHDKPRDKLTLEKIAASSGRRRQDGKDVIFALPCKLISYIVAHTFAVRMIYPGSLSVVYWALRPTLLKGREDLIRQGGERFKLVTSDNNEIDTIFVDQRNKNVNGNILVISCEGNCSFYENGVMSTPFNKGYSVLGWNHPGFGGSTGTPYPAQEQNAIDCVMRFAIERLNFSENQIILYGWSIGGYTATWAAMNYPSIHSLVIDATFDDVLPLALMAMSSSLEGLVRKVIREHFNLNVAEQLNRYNGPVLIIRRTEDEVVCTPNNSLSGNRSNMLLTKLLLRRYPHLFLDNSECGALLTTFLSTEINAAITGAANNGLEIDEKLCLELIAKEKEKNNGVTTYPSTLGQDCDSKTKQQLVLFLITMYMRDQPSSHCTPLDLELFNPGWQPTQTMFVQ